TIHFNTSTIITSTITVFPNMSNLHDIQLFLMDLDGTIYHENELIDGASLFFDLLKKQKKRYVFMTNKTQTISK
ncbi:MAG: hypothetical protein IK117_11080, partial [Bacteroidales bacterium]|nr:hypothetical protein [Bacteroidales bacterium]